MVDFVNYIYESGISLGLFSLLYLLFLRSETFFRTNRLFLLFALVFSVVLPAIHLRVFDPQPVLLGEITVTPFPNLLETVSVYGHRVSQGIVVSISTQTWILGIYLAGALLFFARLLLRLGQLVRIIRKHEVIREQGIRLVVLDKDTAPFSFLGFVFAGRQLKAQAGWEKMLVHELEHVKQGHSVDILVLEILTIFQWFNPMFWLLKRLLRENHEYLADRAVLAHETNSANYKKLLVQQFIGPQFELANNFNYSLIKKRIQMMSKIKSSKLARVKLIGGLVLAAALITVFSLENKVTANEAQRVGLNAETGKVSLLQTNRLTEESQSTLTRQTVAKVMGHKNESDANVIGESAPSVGDDTLKIIVDGQLLKIAGSPAAVAKFKKMFGAGSGYTLVSNAKTGVMELKKELKSNAPDAEKPAEMIDGQPIFSVVEEMPIFPGGELELRKFMANQIKYPVEAQKAKVQGKVYVTFIVDKTGKVRNAKVVRGVDPNLDAEALRVVSALPDWTPGKQRGQAVAVSYTIPINFALQ